MIPATFFYIATVTISFFTLANAFPIGKHIITEPRSLLGRQYNDVRIRNSLTVDDPPTRRFGVEVDSVEPIRRADRFYAIYRKLAKMGSRDERFHAHDKNLLSNQSLGSPPALQTPMPMLSSSPTPSQPSTFGTAVPFNPIPPAHMRVKHFKVKKTEGKTVKV